MTQKITDIHLYTDGSCSGNPGPGGWGVLIKSADQSSELFGGEDATTNNRMEMMAAIKGIEALSGAGKTLHIHTDSTYLKDGITSWVQKWKSNGWKTASNKPVKNQDLWQQLVALTGGLDIHWNWVKGHAGHPGNERADFLARHGMMQKVMQNTVKETMTS